MNRKIILRKNLVLFSLLIFVACQKTNDNLGFYNKKSKLSDDDSSRKPILSIVFNEGQNHVYQTNALLILNDSTYTDKVLLYLFNNKFIAKGIDPKTNDFVLFNLDAELNKNIPIVIKYGKNTKSYGCILEKKIKTDQNLEVYLFTIKNWGKLPALFNGESLDAKLFVTKEYGVIGSYMEGVDPDGKKIMIAPTGNILESDIDYSSIKMATLK